MPSYRFCRPDDIPFLVQAINTCWGVHFADEPVMTVERFRDEMKTIDVWPSNAMVAIQGNEPIAVMIGTKRAEEVLIARIGVHPAFQRQGHGRHLLTSLSQKLAVLGPERLIAEVPDELPGAGAFFRATAYRVEATYTDWVRQPARARPIPDALVTPVSVAQLDEQDLLEMVPGDVAWCRSRDTLRNRGAALSGVALVTDRVEAFAVYEEVAAKRLDVLTLEVRDPGREVLLSGVLLRWIAGCHPKSAIHLPRLAAEELPTVTLERLGFVPGRTDSRYAAVATPG